MRACWTFVLMAGCPSGPEETSPICDDLGCIDEIVLLVETPLAPDGATIAVDLSLDGERHACTATASADLIADCEGFALTALPEGYELRGSGDHERPVDVHLDLRIDGEVVVDRLVPAVWTNEPPSDDACDPTCWSVEGTVTP